MKKIMISASIIFLLTGCNKVEDIIKKLPFNHGENNAGETEKKSSSGQSEELESSNESSTPRQDGVGIENSFALETVYFNQIIESAGKKEIKNPENMLVLVNKEFSLGSEYVPLDLVQPAVAFSFGNQKLEKSLIRKEAATALERMFADAAKSGIELYAVSGYRSYERQEDLFAQEATRVGEQAASQAVALPGASEHQTGLTMDIASKSTNMNLTKEFGETLEGKWLAQHAYEYGFILRYPKGKESITGYQYEPWHFRFVGEKAAKTIFENDWTLEEFFQEVKRI